MRIVKVFLADGFEEIEAIAVVDILRRAQIRVKTVSVSKDTRVTGAHGITVLTDEVFTETKFDYVDMIVLPGGRDSTLTLKTHAGLNELILDFNKKNKYIAAICAAPTVLGNAFICRGKKAVCYPGMERELIDAVISDDNVVVDGNIITSKGPGTSIEFALKLVELLESEEAVSKLKMDLVLC